MSGNTNPSDSRDATAAQANYQPHDRIQVTPGMSVNPYAGLGQPLYPHAFPASAGWTKRQSRWREIGILLALWMLVMLAAVAIGVRVLDLSAGAARPDDYARTGDMPAPRASPAALAASMPAADPFDDDPFDDPLPVLPPAAATPAPAAAATPGTRTETAVPGTRQPVTVASVPAFKPGVPAHRPASPAGTPAEGCSPALSAMQLCGERIR